MASSDYFKSYQQRNIIQKKLIFNRNSPDDMRLIDYLTAQRNFSRYVKDLIRADMREHGIPENPTKKAP